MDSATGLINQRERDYGPGLGRWYEQDPAKFINGLSLYQRLQGSPIKMTDPYGLWDWWNSNLNSDDPSDYDDTWNMWDSPEINEAYDMLEVDDFEGEAAQVALNNWAWRGIALAAVLTYADVQINLDTQAAQDAADADAANQQAMSNYWHADMNNFVSDMMNKMAGQLGGCNKSAVSQCAQNLKNALGAIASQMAINGMAPGTVKGMMQAIQKNSGYVFQDFANCIANACSSACTKGNSNKNS